MSDPKQTWEEQRKLEDQVNAHTIQVGRLLRIGEKWGHWDRVKSALICHFSAVPLLHGYVKDHKKLPPGENPIPPMRPVCSATEANNGALSDILAEVCTTLGDELDREVKTLCLSTEEMLVGIEMVNAKKEEIRKLVVLSMDVEKMYPRMKAERVAAVVADEYRASTLKVEVDPVALGLYLAIMVEREELVAKGLGEVVQTRKRGGGRGRKVGITTAEVTQESVPEEKKLFFPPQRAPTEAEEREMLALALEIAIKVAMGNHLYSFNGSVRLQLEGGPIGNQLSGALAKVYMLYRCRTFLRRLTAATSGLALFCLYMMLFYVDDVNLAMEEMAPGSRFINGKVEVVQEEVEGDRSISGDERTAKVIANSICETVQMEIDFPSHYEDGWMPLLDLQIRENSDNSIDYKWFGKRVSNPLLIMKNSALSEKVKRDSLVQQAMTRLRNTRRTLTWRISADILTEFSLRMKWAGYNFIYRGEVIRAAVVGHDRLLEKVDGGERPLHRPREWNATERRKNKLLGKAAWYRPADVVLFVPATPGSELTSILTPVVKEEGARLGLEVKLVETGGVNLKRRLTGRDLRAGDPCGQPDCLLCFSDERGGGCHRRANCMYKGSCKKCANANLEASYYGESAFSGYYRTDLHGKSILRKEGENAFAKHLNIFHPELEGDVDSPKMFNLKVLQTFKKPLERKVTEAVFINNSKAQIKMNSKAEFLQPAVPRVIATREPPGRGPEHVEGGVQ